GGTPLPTIARYRSAPELLVAITSGATLRGSIFPGGPASWAASRCSVSYCLFVNRSAAVFERDWCKVQQPGAFVMTYDGPERRRRSRRGERIGDRLIAVATGALFL